MIVQVLSTASHQFRKSKHEYFKILILRYIESTIERKKKIFT